VAAAALLGALVVARPGAARSDAKDTAKAPVPAKPAALGVSYFGWKGQYADAAKRVASFKELGFQVVSFIPTYGYVGRNKIDLGSGPDPAELANAVEVALRSGPASIPSRRTITAGA
jgi:hypothetical protein